MAMKFLREQDERRLKKVFQATLRQQFGVVHSVPDYDDRALLDPEEAEVKISKKELYQMLLGKLIDDELEEEAMQDERLSSSVDE